jgi:uracil-DNA glycosylase
MLGHNDYPGAALFVPGSRASLATAPPGGKRRIHERPDTRQVRACWPWLAAELARLAPSVVVTLGATAGQALFGSSFRVTGERGKKIAGRAPALREERERDVTVVPTIHPSAVLRADDGDAAYAGLVSDLRVAAAALPGGQAGQAGRSRDRGKLCGLPQLDRD